MSTLCTQQEGEKIDAIENFIAEHLTKVNPVPRHVFTPGIYTRALPIDAKTLITSKTHKIEHPYVIMCGKVSVWEPETGVTTYHAGHFGTTKEGTRRVLFVHDSVLWVTFHPNPTDTKDLKKIEDYLITPRANTLEMEKLEKETNLSTTIIQQLLKGASS